MGLEQGGLRRFLSRSGERGFCIRDLGFVSMLCVRLLIWIGRSWLHCRAAWNIWFERVYLDCG